MIAVIDYGMGNLRSVQKALQRVGADARVTHSAEDILKADKIVLPGVGAMGAAMDKLDALGLIQPIHTAIDSGKPFLGICVGLQLLFENSEEGVGTTGLGILQGSVKKFTDLKVPQMGWNELSIQNSQCQLLNGLAPNSEVYFCHSYYVDPTQGDVVATTTNYGREYVSSICRGNLYGVQFHPEKSQTVGLKILENFVSLKL